LAGGSATTIFEENGVNDDWLSRFT
jgi:hypothetical protein